jgi:pyruvate/2-oxoacid:ferredoxin oxidoreductase alpha subunit
MAIELSDEDFAVIHAALFQVCHPFTEDQIGAVLKGERAAWKVVDRVASEVGLSRPGGALLAGGTSLGGDS